jgi:phosphate transporter family protein
MLAMRTLVNDMYLTSEALRIMQKSGKPEISAADAAVLKNYKGYIDRTTRFIPPWVKVAVAIAVGLGTMVGWKRIVVTFGEKIGKNHLTYAQGAAAEITAMANHRCSRLFWLAGQCHSRLVVWRRRHHGRESLRFTVGHGSQPHDGLGADSSRRHDALGLPVLDFPQDSLRRLVAPTAALPRNVLMIKPTPAANNPCRSSAFASNAELHF